MSHVKHTHRGGNIVTKGNKRTTTEKCGCIKREKQHDNKWTVRFEFVCPAHMDSAHA